MQHFNSFRVWIPPLPLRRYSCQTNECCRQRGLASKPPPYAFKQQLISHQQRYNGYLQLDVQYVGTLREFRGFQTLFIHTLRLPRDSATYQRYFTASALLECYKPSSDPCQSVSESPPAVCASPRKSIPLLPTPSQPHFIRNYA